MKSTNRKESLMTGNIKLVHDERVAPHSSGMLVLILVVLLSLAAIAAIVFGAIGIDAGAGPLDIALFVLGIVWFAFPMWMLIAGLKVVQPNEAYVLTLFGKYHGTLRKDGFYFVNPFVAAVNPLKASAFAEAANYGSSKISVQTQGSSDKSSNSRSSSTKGSRISLKAMTLSNNKQKINDKMGNPIEIGIVVIWKVVNTARACFNVDNFEDYLSTQTDSALRNIVRLYPYDIPGEDEGELSLRGSSQEIASRIRDEIQEKVELPALRLWRRASPALPTRPKLPPPCCSASRPAPLLMRGRS